MQWKTILMTAAAVVVGLIAYDMFVKKMINKDEATFDSSMFDEYKPSSVNYL